MSKIQWTGMTWNPIAGCSDVSEGCRHCYARAMAKRLSAMGETKYDGLTVLQGSKTVWTGKIAFDEKALLAPLRRKKPTTYFVNSMSDVFHPNVTDEQIDRIFAVMALCPQHTFQCLTKRPERMLAYMRSRQWAGGEYETFEAIMDQVAALVGIRMVPTLAKHGGNNVWLGVSVEDQKTADARIPLLLQTPAAIRFVSYEPALELVDFTHVDWVEEMKRDYSAKVDQLKAKQDTELLPMLAGMLADVINCKWEEGRAWRNALTGAWYDGWDGDDNPEPDHATLDWIIVGGESGPNARPFDVEWARSVVAQCKAAGVACFVKQLGSFPVEAKRRSPVSGDGPELIATLYTELATKDRKGGDMAEWPEDLRVRELPEVRA